MDASSGMSMGFTIVWLVVLFGIMYFLMIRPQKKRDKQIQEMRSSLQVGDEIITIGGICGKIVKTKDETIVLQVGADKIKFEMMRWSVSQVVNPSNKHKASIVEEDDEEETPKKKAMPRKLKKAAEAEETAESEKLEKEAIAEEKAEERAEEAEAMVEKAAEERTEEMEENNAK